MDFLEDLEKAKLLEEKYEAHRKLRESFNLEKIEISPEKVENLLDEYSSLTPLNLVNTIETSYPSIIHSSKLDSLNTLSSYKSSHNLKFDLLNFEHKNNISSTLKQKMEDINCTNVSEENLFLGDNNGKVIMHQIESGNEIKNFSIQQYTSPLP